MHHAAVAGAGSGADRVPAVAHSSLHGSTEQSESARCTEMGAPWPLGVTPVPRTGPVWRPDGAAG